MGSAEGALKTAAARIGLTPDEYRALVAAGLRYCFRCKSWHPRADFGRNLEQPDGLDRACRTSQNARARRRYRERKTRNG